MFPQLYSTCQKLYYARKKTIPPLPKTIGDITINDEWSKTQHGERLLLKHITQDKKQFIILVTDHGLKRLANSLRWHMDGTFSTAMKGFQQQYIIHAYTENADENPNQPKGFMVPCVWVMMTNRNEEDYVTVFETLKTEAKSLKMKLSPKLVMTDFERGAMNACEYVFNCKVMGCYFHFAQSLYKNLVLHNLKSQYQETRQVNNNLTAWFLRLLALAYVPPDLVRYCYEEFVKKEIPEYTFDGDRVSIRARVEAFCLYFENIWLDGRYKILEWNQFSNYRGPRTNNHVEGYNARISRLWCAAHPNIYKWIRNVRYEENVAFKNALHIESGDYHTPNVGKKYRKKERLIIDTVERYQVNGDLVPFINRIRVLIGVDFHILNARPNTNDVYEHVVNLDDEGQVLNVVIGGEIILVNNVIENVMANNRITEEEDSEEEECEEEESEEEESEEEESEEEESEERESKEREETDNDSVTSKLLLCCPNSWCKFKGQHKWKKLNVHLAACNKLQ
jgi:hypothetical protein